ncbi:hypothetical protein ACJ41O_003429 [Fusarium nematophilum]
MPFACKSLLRSKSLYLRQKRCEARRRHSFDGVSTRSQIPPWPRSPFPSPYEILGVRAGNPYDKETFRQLVKVYHPDLLGQNPAISNLSFATRLERYRLIIAANELLSDPKKRNMYDLHNVGWVFKDGSLKGGSVPTANAYTGAYGSTPHYKPMRQEPIYASNGAFAILLAIVAMAGAIMQNERARASRQRHKTLDLALHHSILRDLQDVILPAEDSCKDERVLEFLARRQIGLVRCDGQYHPSLTNYPLEICSR